MPPKQKPVGFRKWVTLENLHKNLVKAVEGSDFPDRMFAYLSTAFGNDEWEKKPWETLVFSFVESIKTFSVDTSLPLIKDAPKDGKEPDWEYEGRSWNYLSHVLAKAYGWPLDYIGEMNANEAMAHIQEILTDDHLEHEFIYSLSEIAYPYNKSTKKSEFKPMPRPYWMKPVAPKTVKRIKLRKDALPIGRVIDVSGLPPEFAIENYETEKPDAKRNSHPVPPAS